MWRCRAQARRCRSKGVDGVAASGRSLMPNAASSSCHCRRCRHPDLSSWPFSPLARGHGIYVSRTPLITRTTEDEVAVHLEEHCEDLREKTWRRSACERPWRTEAPRTGSHWRQL
uniref:Uncharacterized protein n=1 Tax=Arundo donax TaxID=35708 RepID=A0A0A9D0X3_ARUDO